MRRELDRAQRARPRLNGDRITAVLDITSCLYRFDATLQLAEWLQPDISR
jgi:hypothetical protein